MCRRRAHSQTPPGPSSERETQRHTEEERRRENELWNDFLTRKREGKRFFFLDSDLGVAASLRAMVSEGSVEGRRGAVLTAPLALDGGLAAEHGAPNLIQRVLSLFRNDLTRFQLPPLFNMPKSQLQCYGEAVYCVGDDMLSRCARGKTSLERFTSVVAWSISTTRPAIFGMAPFNPILGETHHVSRGTLNVLLEQVSHHPPVSALHAADEKENVELIWCHNPLPRFHGRSVEALINGKRQLRLLSLGETYEMDSPNLLIKILPVPGTAWVGNVTVRCRDSGLEADLLYCKSHSFLGIGGNPRSIKGKIFHSKSLETIYEISGQWDRTVELKDVHSGELKVLYNANEAISKLKTPTVKDLKGLSPTESTCVWSEVSQAILSKDWEKAREAKRSIEERERELQRERMAKGDTWAPKHFTLAHIKDGRWECWPLEKSVAPAPIIVPL